MRGHAFDTSEKLFHTDLWNDVLGAMIAVRNAHGWSE